ncbi:MAG: methyltransferase regulatory domain-containing protein [Alphaproteobacteria bacterium]|nr:methyltransferase regulatory domain-containing protein [Alphaproteobacteria bacterium]
MTAWSGGYVSDIPYTAGFYRETAPSHISFALAVQGMRLPPFGPGSTYCELGCGQGFGTNLLAAANPLAKFWGIDFNPAQIANAETLASEARLKNVTFLDWSFEQTLSRTKELPQFDMIVLHGIYSWISESNRQAIVTLLDQILKPGGVVYISYNCMPGWAVMAPFQRLLFEHAQRNPDQSDVQIRAAIEFATTLKRKGAQYFASNPGVAPRIERMEGLSTTYLAHEYLNGHWHPLYHSDVARELAPARLTYVGSATIAENIDAVAVPPELMEAVSGVRDRTWQETIRDYISNKQFRRDLFIRGPSALNKLELSRALLSQKLCLAVPGSAVTFRFQGPLSDVVGQEEVYRPIVQTLGNDVKSIGQLLAVPELGKIGLSLLVQAISLLVHSGQVLPVIAESQNREGSIARNFNKVVALKIKSGYAMSSLAAPVAGTAIGATYTDLIAVLGLIELPRADADALTRRGWEVMKETGQRLLKGGSVLQTDEENISELKHQMTVFLTEKAPIWRCLGVI